MNTQDAINFVNNWRIQNGIPGSEPLTGGQKGSETNSFLMSKPML
jgi:hypothetical protein